MGKHQAVILAVTIVCSRVAVFGSLFLVSRVSQFSQNLPSIDDEQSDSLLPIFGSRLVIEFHGCKQRFSSATSHHNIAPWPSHPLSPHPHPPRQQRIGGRVLQ